MKKMKLHFDEFEMEMHFTNLDIFFFLVTALYFLNYCIFNATRFGGLNIHCFCIPVCNEIEVIGTDL